MSRAKTINKKQLRKETPRILADITHAEVHPSTINHPGMDAPIKLRAMHSIHSALLRGGRIADRVQKRKTPDWPLNGDRVSVLGYGAEKVTYRVSGTDREHDSVVAVYHLDSMKQAPLDVIADKKTKYEIYKRYFGDLVLPTSFVVLDNPWGNGAKPAYIQPYIKDAEKFSSFSETELKTKAAHDVTFAQRLDKLTQGYAEMLGDGLCPDFASSNLLVSGSDVVIFDIGLIWESDQLARKAEIHPNYRMIENLITAEVE